MHRERARKLPRTISHRSEAPRAIIRSRSAVAAEQRQIEAQRNKKPPERLRGSSYGYEGDFDSDESIYLNRQDTDLEYYDEFEDDDEFELAEDQFDEDDDWDTEYEAERSSSRN